MKLNISIFVVLLCAFLMPYDVQAVDKKPIEITADTALEWDRGASTFTARGNALAVQGDDQISATIITANYHEAADGGMTIEKMTAAPNAKIIRPKETLKADKIVATMKDSALDQVEATGGVILETETETITGDKGIYNALAKHITVIGNVKITQGHNILTGAKAVFDMNTGKSRLSAARSDGGSGRVKAVFYPGGK